jgi:DNA-directed RNA polymerase specialized sigma24 family protein
MLGSVMDAEDVVQEAYLRWQRAPEAETLLERRLARVSLLA